MKKRRFYDGGEVREKRHEGIEDATRMRAMEFMRQKQEERAAEREGLELVGASEPSAPSEAPAAKKAAPAARRPVAAPRPKEASPAPRTSAPSAPEPEVASAKTESPRFRKDAYPPDRMEAVFDNAREPLLDSAIEPIAGNRSVGNIAHGVTGNRRMSRENSALSPLEWEEVQKRAQRQRKFLKGPHLTDNDELKTEKYETENFKRGGKVKKYAKGGSVSSASKRGDGIAQRGKTKGRMY